MASLSRCSSCGSFVVAGSCPSCGSTLVRATKLGLLATMLGSGAFAMTLMACYGCPDCTIDTYARDAEADATEDSGQVVPVDDSGTSDAAPDAHQGDSGKDAGSDADADAG